MKQRPIVSQKAQAARARLEAKVKGVGFNSAGPGSLIIDVGTATTKIGVVGELLSAAVVPTPSAVAVILKAIEMDDKDAAIVSGFVFNTVMLLAPQAASNAGRCAIVLCDAQSTWTSRPGRNLLTAQLRRVVASHTLLHVCNQAIALSAAGLTSGVVVDIGYAATRVVPVIGTVAVDNAIILAPMGMRRVLEHMTKSAQDQLGQQVPIPEYVFESALRAFALAAPRRSGDDAAQRSAEAILEAVYVVSYKNMSFSCSPSQAIEAVFFDTTRDADGDGGVSLGRLVVDALLKCCPLTQRPIFRNAPLVLIGGGGAVTNMACRLSEEVASAALPLDPTLSLRIEHTPLPVAPSLLPVTGASVVFA